MVQEEARLNGIQNRGVIQEYMELLSYHSLNYFAQEWKVDTGW